MFHLEKVGSHIVITDDIDLRVSELKERLHPHRVIVIEKDDFLVEDATKVIAESYISEENTKYIILAAKRFNTISQNALLKVLEEPPRNIEYIIITSSKSSLLPTVRSRLNIKSYKANKTIQTINLKLSSLGLVETFEFIKDHERLKSHDAKELIEAIMHQATSVENISLNEKQLEAFELSYKLIDLNGNMRSILSMILMSFL